MPDSHIAMNWTELGPDATNNAGPRFRFVDVFAGCGGLSLGLMQAGFEGLFAIEKSPSAFETLRHNLICGKQELLFNWPDWLPIEPVDAADCLSRFRSNLLNLRGTVDLLVGGPPCQGYSSAGRRDPDDPRNVLFDTYLEFVRLLRPAVVLVENVKGMTLDFKDNTDTQGKLNYATSLVEALKIDYDVHARMIDLSTFGVPQSRTRFFVIGLRKDLKISSDLPSDPFVDVMSSVLAFLGSKGLTAPLASKAAISDLERSRNGTKESEDSEGFRALSYKEPITPYQRLMRKGCDKDPPDTRLPNHKPEIAARFAEIIKTCHADGRLNMSLTKDAREAYGLKKNAIRVLDPDRPSPTVTSMPDDLIHYSEPRTLTVRENARLQSFPDWFQFCGQYTTGGHRRRSQVPRYTQVANAVPPLVSEAIGLTLYRYLMSVKQP